MPTFAELNLKAGFLTDRQMKLALDAGTLITRNTWIPESIRHASYTLRLGTRVEVARAAAANIQERRDFVIQELEQGQYFDLQPGDTAKLFSIEILDLPATILCFTVARGLMFVEALVPENTYADPGFAGELYTTVTNQSHRTVRLRYADPIARLFFYNLTEPVEVPFERGAARGIKQRLESFRASKVATPGECSAASNKELLEAIAPVTSGGPAIAEIAQRISRKLFGAIAFSAVWPITLLVANRNEWIQNKLLWLGSNVAALIISATISAAAPYLWKKLNKV